METQFTDRFKRSFKPVVELRKAGDECSLKRHFRGVLREVVGAMDYLAALDTQRFVFAYVDGIARQCHKFRKGKRGKQYSLRNIEYALAYLRAHGVIRYAVREGRLGYLVVDHDDMTLPHKNTCIVVGCASRSLEKWVALPGDKFPVHRPEHEAEPIPKRAELCG